MRILNDFSTSVKKALEEIDPNYMDYEGLVICGTHSPELHKAEQMIEAIYEARIKKIPFLGICFGHQLAYIEHRRTVCNRPNAHSQEINPLGEICVVRREEGLKVGLHEGETWWNYYECLEENWEKPPHFITCQYHPEYQSSKEKPHPLLVNFLNLCHGK